MVSTVKARRLLYYMVIRFERVQKLQASLHMGEVVHTRYTVAPVPRGNLLLHTIY